MYDKDGVLNEANGDTFKEAITHDAIYLHGEKNLFPRSPEKRTNAGITFPPQNNGSITVVGTASQESWSSASGAQLPAGEYILSGSKDGVATEV